MNKSDLEGYLGDTVFLAEDEISPFCRLASTVSVGPIVEIGAGMGSSAVLFLYNSNVPVHSVDSFTGDSEGKWSSSEERCRRNVTKALRALGKPEAYAKWVLHTQLSHSLAPQWRGKIELLYLDGNHQYDFVRQDFEDWIYHVMPNGVVLIHDSCRNPNAIPGHFDHGWEGPTKLANELRSDTRVAHVESFFSTTVWRKI